MSELPEQSDRPLGEVLAEQFDLVSAFLDALPYAVVVVDETGRINRVNEEAELLFGYHRNLMLGKAVEMLVPDGVRDKHPTLREGYMANPVLRPMGVSVEVRARRKNGSELPVLISLKPCITVAGTYVVAAVQRKSG